MNESLIDRAKKIYELSVRGIDGEKENAKRMLDLFLKKYGLTLEEIAGDVRKSRVFKISSNDDEFLLIHSVKVTCDSGIYKSVVEKYRVVDLTDYEFIQVSELYEFHKQNFKTEKKKVINSFEQAYYHKHGLFDFVVKKEPDPNRKPKKDPEINLEMVMSIYNGMKNSFRKSIG